MTLGSVALVLVLAGAGRADPLIRVSQESAPGLGDFDSHVLGTLTAFGTTMTAAGFYDYDGANLVSYGNNGPTLTAGLSHLFLVNASDGLSLFIVHDKPDAAHGTRTADMRFDLVGDMASYLVLDDNLGLPDLYANTGPTLFTAHNSWGNLRTDGVVIGSLDNQWTLFAQMTAPPTGGVTGWQAISENGSTFALALTTGRRVRLDEAVAAAVPEPATVLLAGLGAAALLGRGWRQRRRGA
jgi:hypothetical protein